MAWNVGKNSKSFKTLKLHNAQRGFLSAESSSAGSEPPGAGGRGRKQLQERQIAGILLFTPKFCANPVQRLWGWAEHSEVLPSVSSRFSGESRGLQTAGEDGRALAIQNNSGTVLGQFWDSPGILSGCGLGGYKGRVLLCHSWEKKRRKGEN